MRKIAIKLCGLNTERAVEAAAGLGPDFAGFVIYPRSPRHVSPETMQRLKARLQAGTKTVAVLADPDDALLEQVMHTAAPDYLQLHGAEQASRLHHIRDRYHVRLIKALPVRTANDIDRASAFENAADILLFDALPADAALPGGSGKPFDWHLLEGRSFPLPWMLSGGLNSDNVAGALRITGARMVDVSSGIESSPGVKDAVRMEAFVRAVRNAEMSLS